MLKRLLFCLAIFAHTQPAISKPMVFACEPEWQSLAQEIGQDKIKSYSATTGRQDPHHIEARPSLISKARRADILFCSGADLEIGWLPILLKKASNKKILPGSPGHLMASDHLHMLEKHAKVDRSMGDIHEGGNPHVHLSPDNISIMAKVFTDALKQLDPENAEYYKNNLQSFSQRWQSASNEWKQQASLLSNKAFVTHHRSWVYLADWAKLDMSITLEEKPGIPPSTKYLNQLIQTVKNKRVSKIIYSAHSNPKAAQWLSRHTGVPAVELPFTVGGSKNVNNLFELFDETFRLLLK